VLIVYYHEDFHLRDNLTMGKKVARGLFIVNFVTSFLERKRDCNLLIIKGDKEDVSWLYLIEPSLTTNYG
jgi:hypothetical protein